ncbi:MAG: glycosyltransferase family 2 protein, partial [Myxococcota bacterium]
MPETPSVTIGFVPRDRFCMAPAALAHLLDHTRPPFRLLVVDTGTPGRFREPIERLVANADQAELLRADGASSNAARNLVLRECDSDYVCLIENDVFVHDGWLERLVAACEGHPADVAAPLLLEPRGAVEKVHFDDRLGHIRRDAGTGRLAIVPRETPLESDRGAPRRKTDFVEMHCVLFRRASFAQIGPFDEEQFGSRAEVDLSLALYAAGVSTVLEPASQVVFSPPPPVYPEEREFYLHYWDLVGNEADHRRIESRWNVLECPSAMGFVAGRRRIPDVPDPAEQLRRFHADLEAQRRAAAELAALVPETDLVVLVDDAQW